MKRRAHSWRLNRLIIKMWMSIISSLMIFQSVSLAQMEEEKNVAAQFVDRQESWRAQLDGSRKLLKLRGQIGGMTDSSTPELQDAVDVVAQDGRVWVKDATLGWLAVDLSNPDAPNLTGPVGLPAGEEPLAVERGIVYASGSDGGLRVYRLTGKKCETVARVRTRGAIQAAVKRGDFLYAASEAGLIVFDVGNPATPVEGTTVLAGKTCAKLEVKGERLWVEADDLYLLDLAEPTRPRQLGMMWVGDEFTTGTAEPGPAWQPETSMKGWCAVSGERVMINWISEKSGLRFYDYRGGGSFEEAPLENDEGVDVDGGVVILWRDWILSYPKLRKDEDDFDDDETLNLYEFDGALHVKPVAYSIASFDFFAINGCTMTEELVLIADGPNGLVVLDVNPAAADPEEGADYEDE